MAIRGILPALAANRSRASPVSSVIPVVLAPKTTGRYTAAGATAGAARPTSIRARMAIDERTGLATWAMGRRAAMLPLRPEDFEVPPRRGRLQVAGPVGGANVEVVWTGSKLAIGAGRGARLERLLVELAEEGRVRLVRAEGEPYPHPVGSPSAPPRPGSGRLLSSARTACDLRLRRRRVLAV